MITADELLNLDMEYARAAARDELETLAGSTVLITGGAGFLGYSFVNLFLHWNRHEPAERQIRVTVYDNFVRGRPAWLDALAGEPTLAVETVDLIQPLPADFPGFDWVIHAAGIASPPFYRARPLETIDANINGLRNLLEDARSRQGSDRPVKGFLFYSSSEIYGDPVASAIPTPEDYRGNVSCTGPRACYDESKRFGETLCVVFSQQFGLPITVARPFNNYGPGLKITDRRVIPDFARDILAGNDIVMLSDGSPTRTFCYVADAVVGYIKVLVNGRPGEAYNIGIDRPEISIGDLAELAAKTANDLWGYTGRVVRGEADEQDYLVDNPARRCPDMTKSRRDLGYNPTILPDEGVRRSMIWYYHNPVGVDA
jgi:nucleoside-diphosphate-sugar epimerase